MTRRYWLWDYPDKIAFSITAIILFLCPWFLFSGNSELRLVIIYMLLACFLIFFIFYPRANRILQQCEEIERLVDRIQGISS